MALSPPVMYSNVSTELGTPQPLPVVVTTSRYARSKPPARSRSLTASCARSSTSSADRHPGVGADRLGRRFAGEGSDVLDGRTAPSEGASLASQRIPRHQRFVATGA